MILFDQKHGTVSDNVHLQSKLYASKHFLSASSEMLCPSIPQKDTETPVSILCQLIIQEIRTRTVNVDSDGSTDITFFDHLLSEYGEEFHQSYNICHDSFEVHTRQMMILMKYASIINGSSGIYSISPSIPSLPAVIQKLLFDTFWNSAPWTLLFPSMPSIASMIHDSRKECLLLIEEYGNTFYLDHFASDLLLITGIECANDLYFTSCVDFSLIQWFKLFGLLDCYPSQIDRRITIELTPLFYSYAQHIQTDLMT